MHLDFLCFLVKVALNFKFQLMYWLDGSDMSISVRAKSSQGRKVFNPVSSKHAAIKSNHLISKMTHISANRCWIVFLTFTETIFFPESLYISFKALMQ